MINFPTPRSKSEYKFAFELKRQKEKKKKYLFINEKELIFLEIYEIAFIWKRLSLNFKFDITRNFLILVI